MPSSALRSATGPASSPRIWNVTAGPTAGWVWRRLIEATPWGRQPRYFGRDRDGVYGRDFPEPARRLGIETVLAPVRAHRSNAVAERVIGTLRRECFDHVVVNERHLRALLAEFVRFCNAERPHRTLGLDTPIPETRPSAGPIRSRAVLGGLHRVYGHAA
jgi:transposase InsO family protein